MSVSTEVHRTLVKSPPELWTELSCPAALARHLTELGEIRITSLEPETTVEWESECASGVVRLKQSGWGTKVTLSVTRDAPAPDEPSELEPVAVVELEPTTAPEPEAIPETEPVAVLKPDPPPPAVEPEHVEEPEHVDEPDTIAIVEPDAVEPKPVALEPEHHEELEPITIVKAGGDAHTAGAAESEPETQLGFFARLFRRRRVRPAKGIEPEIALATEREPTAVVEPEPEIVALAAPEPIYPAPPVEPAADLAAELQSVEAQMTEETTELLTGVLDRLGAAHHRPFSRG